MNRLSGRGNYVYIGTLGAEVTTPGALSGEKFFKITQIAAESSGFPVTAKVNSVVYNKPAITIVSGDGAKPFTLTKLAFATGEIPLSASKEKFDNTLQDDTAKSYEEGERPEITGSIPGYFVAPDATVKAILNRFFEVVSDDGAGVRTYSGIQSGTLHLFLGRNETTTVGQIEIMQYLPVIVDSLTIDKPKEGPQLFNLNYTVVGGERPSIYERTITA